MSRRGWVISSGSKWKAKRAPCRQGATHPSKLEARRCDELHLLQLAGEISDLKAHPQPCFDLKANGQHVCFYYADFDYIDARRGRVVEDTKGLVTDVFKLKARLMKACLGIEVEIVRKGGRR